MRRLRPSLSRHNVELSVVMDAVAIGEDLRALGRDGSAEGAPLTGAASILSARMLLMPAFAGRAGDSRWKIGHRLSAIGRSLGGAAMLASSTVNEGRAFIFKRINVFSSKVNLSFDDANATSDSIRADEDIGEDNIIRHSLWSRPV